MYLCSAFITRDKSCQKAGFTKWQIYLLWESADRKQWQAFKFYFLDVYVSDGYATQYMHTESAHLDVRCWECLISNNKCLIV